MVRLWCHETLRVFHDRLVSADDRRWYCTALAGAVQKHLGMRFSEAFGGDAEPEPALRRLMYGDFMTPNAAVSEGGRGASDSLR